MDKERRMEQTLDREYKRLIAFDTAMIVFFAITLLIGTFNDEAIAGALFTPNNLFIKYLTSTGVFPFFAGAVFFTGSLCERIIDSDLKKAPKILLCIVFYAAATFVGFIGAGSIVDKDCLGSIFPALNRNIPVIIGICLVTNPLLLVAGFLTAGKVQDRKFVKRLITVLVLLGLSYALMQIFKGAFSRPRYRLVVQDYEGTGFIPWYIRFNGAGELVEKFGIDKGEFRSFPSGHSILSMSVIVILQMLSRYFEKLKDKQLILGVVGFVFALMIMGTRMILGAHYLSDVSFGALISSVMALVFTAVQHRITTGPNS